jgi:hypothetical protein
VLWLIGMAHVNSNKPSSLSQTQFLLTSLIFIIIFILALVVILAVYPSLLAPSPTITPTITLTSTITPTITETPSLTPIPSATRTLRPTLTPSQTSTPTRTLSPTPTLTPPGPATLTPAAPLGGESNYRLHKWSAERARELADMMYDFPNTLPESKRGADYKNYNASFSYSYYAIKEAILRYPDQLQEQKWRWQIAYSLAHLADPDAGQAFGDLIAAGLNSGAATPQTIQKWFHSQEPRLSLEITRLEALSGSVASYLVEVKGQGSAFILITETSSAFQFYPLTSDFDYTRPVSKTPTITPTVQPTPIIPPKYAANLQDLTGDGIAEILIYLPDSLQNIPVIPRIFQVDHLPPVEIFIDPAYLPFDPGMDNEIKWRAATLGGKNVLQSVTTLFPACPLEVQHNYFWNGDLFEFRDADFIIRPFSETLSYCNYLVDHASTRWGAEAAISIMETLLPDWPPAETEDGKPYPLDAKDEWKFRLAVYHASLGNQEKARRYLNEVISSPSLPASRWIIPAREFLNSYNKPEDVYRACLAAPSCQPAWALQYLLDLLKSEDYPDLLTYLYKQGVTLRASGYFDFDGDDVRDIWFTVRHQVGEKLQLWLTMQYKDKIAAINQGTIDTNAPGLSYYDDEVFPPIVLLNDQKAFQVNRSPISLQPYLTPYDLPKEYPNRFKVALQEQIDQLFAGTEPKSVQKGLLEIQKSPGLLCKASWTCDEYYYFLGLASELSGDETNAISAYLRLWWDYWQSPFTIMARMKLRQLYVPSPTPTQTQTPTSTPMPSVTTASVPTAAFATMTPTPTRTATKTPGPNYTPTKTSIHPTNTSYPGPYPGPKTQVPYP